MDPVFAEMISVDSNRAFNFFLSGLSDISNKDKHNQETLYVASVLAHYAQVSCFSRDCVGPFSNLSQIFDTFFLNNLFLDDPEMLEVGGSQVLLLSGFFRDQMKKRHNVNWYDKIGCSFYDQAASLSKDPKKKELFYNLSVSLPEWNLICRNFNRQCFENRFLLKIN